MRAKETVPTFTISLFVVTPDDVRRSSTRRWDTLPTLPGVTPRDAHCFFSESEAGAAEPSPAAVVPPPVAVVVAVVVVAVVAVIKMSESKSVRRSVVLKEGSGGRTSLPLALRKL